MANVKVLLLSFDTPLSDAVEEAAAQAEIHCSRQSIEEWPWHDPQSMTQKLRQSGASICIFTGLLEAPTRQWPAIQELASACHQSGLALIFSSTNEVYSHHQGGLYTEKDEPSPKSPFGIEAVRIEAEIQQYCPRHVILRAGWLFSDKGHNLLTYFLDTSKTETELRVPSAFKIAPLHAEDYGAVVAAVILQVALTETLWGVYHCNSTDSIDLYHFVEALLTESKQYEAFANIELIADETVNLPIDIPIRGGLLSSKKLMYHFGIKPKVWRPPLVRALKRALDMPAESVAS